MCGKTVTVWVRGNRTKTSVSAQQLSSSMLPQIHRHCSSFRKSPSSRGCFSSQLIATTGAAVVFVSSNLRVKDLRKVREMTEYSCYMVLLLHDAKFL
jgi:hypothetical protein